MLILVKGAFKKSPEKYQTPTQALILFLQKSTITFVKISLVHCENRVTFLRFFKVLLQFPAKLVF